MSAPMHDQTEPTEVLDELAARRHRGSQTPTASCHRTRRDYSSVLELLTDADRLIDDLTATSAEQILVPIDELTFTGRRLRVLLDAATVELRRAGGQP